MYEYEGLHDLIFIALYCVAAFAALVAAVYLLWRRGNAFMREKAPGGPERLGLALIALFVGFFALALRRYGRWLRDNFADLEHKEVWHSLTFAVGLCVVYEVYTSNGGELLREYLSQVITLAIIAFLLWRVETLQELPGEEEEME